MTQQINDQSYPLAQQLAQQPQLTHQQKETRKKIPMEMCNQGRKQLNQKKYLQASKCFSKAIMGFEFLLKKALINKQQTHYILKDVILPSYSNLSLCYLKLNMHQSVIKIANQTIKYDSQNVKAYYRRGIAYKQLNYYDHAITDFKTLISLDKTEQALGYSLIKQCNRLKTIQHQRQRKIAKKLIENYHSDQSQPNQNQGCLKKILKSIVNFCRKITFRKS